MLAATARLLIATVWCGSLWTIGYLVAPTVFATLADRVLAGSIAGSLFRIEAWLSLVAGALLLLIEFRSVPAGRRGRRHVIAIAGMLACTVFGYFGIQPFMAELKAAAGPGGLMAPDLRARFGMLHGVSSAFYLVQSLLAVWLMAGLARAMPGQGSGGDGKSG